MTRLAFSVTGTPSFQGNKTGYIQGGKVKLVEGRRPEARKHFKSWRAAVSEAAEEARGDLPSFTGPINLSLTFRLRRPKSHYRTGRHAGELKPSSPVFCSSRPDWDKLARAIGDSLTDAGVYKDDSQVATAHVRKVYADAGRPVGVDVVVEELDAILEEQAQ